MENEKTTSDDVTARSILAYVAMLIGAVAFFLVVRSVGSRIVAPPGSGFGARSTGGSVDVLFHFLVAWLLVVVASRSVGALFKGIRQPPVMGEVVAGIVLGPSLLGRIAPGAAAYLFPSAITGYLSIVAQVGVILFMFLVGLELDTSLLRKRTQATLAISHASIVAPFVLGSAVALWVYPTLSTRDVPFGVFALFMGVAMSVTAFPVLARILTDLGLQKTRIGVVALSSAAVDDVTAWCLLAFVVSVAKARVGAAVVTIGLTVAYVAFMFAIVRPLAKRFADAQEITRGPSREAIALVFIGLVASALVTESIGVHALFGAFLLGALLPHGSLLAKELRSKIEDLVVVLLLPTFFAVTGLRTQIGLVHGTRQWLMCAAIIAVACVGKFGGGALAARATGLGLRDAAAIGILMNTRGLMELIVLNVGLDLRVISPPLFAMMVIMAVVTTFATTPLLRLVVGREAEGTGLIARTN